ncbi:MULTISPECIES: nuclear transport factor 2 family protein [unclassified Beijerinckia]|uniref:nuclear transport factor 2 family protein n=1 Tax=unclassified Beijerinckia TaxID=2638183 RepID=UPI00089C1984|nr:MULTISPECIES: nuclear transport factor 2 family protein [unclassified Beijerinckia]MDH7795428.1 hypothetical protein [Beijerinckia sp. GAS462]SEC01143.1 protein of unknown function [Beijerinckia sp. 28-YEA-48]
MSVVEAGDREAVVRAERALAEAHLSLALGVIDDLLHPDYVIVQPGGSVEAKAEVLASYRTGTRRWDKAGVDQLDVRLYDGTVVVIGRWQASGQNGAEHFDYQARFLSVWVKQNGRWQNVAYQSTEISGD